MTLTRRAPRRATDARPPHHDPAGGYRNPWMEADDQRGLFHILRWRWERIRSSLPPDPPPSAFPLASSGIQMPSASSKEIVLTWVGHATVLIQIGGLNALTDPVWSERASPFQWAGPRRLAPPGVRFDQLPPIDAVVLSHDHYDHLDEPTVRRIHRRWGARTAWITPLGYRRWLGRRGVRNVRELDWWESAEVEAESGAIRVTALPAQHWTKRGPFRTRERLWASFHLEGGGRSVYFGGDSGYFSGYREIGERRGPFDAAILPIGAYDPRWFMAPQHMNPEEAVQAHLDLRGDVFVAAHWGTFRLTDEDMLEPPERVRAAWDGAGLAERRLWVPRHGETRVL